uniref:Uncharacterized protein n=1 Tax=viral metagenome TaxID=1070528 RepID=A0A6C0ECZ6_9ZZZZ
MTAFSKLVNFKNRDALDVYNKALSKFDLGPLSSQVAAVIDCSVKKREIVGKIVDVFSYTVTKDDVHYADPRIGPELSKLVPRTSIILHDPITGKVYPTFALKKLSRSSPDALETKQDRIAKLKISRKVNGKPCSLQIQQIDGETFVVFIQKKVHVHVPLTALEAFQSNQIMDYFSEHDQLKELFEVINTDLDKYIKLLNLLGENSVITGELDDGRHIECPSGPKMFVLHTAMNGLTSIDFSVIEEYCRTNSLACVTYDTIVLSSEGSKLHHMWAHLMEYAKKNLNCDTEGWVVLVLDDQDNLIMPMKAKKLPYTIMRSLRQMLLHGKRSDVVTEHDLHRCIDEFKKIFREDPGKTRYFGITKKGQRRWLEWLENQFAVFAARYRSAEGIPMMREDVSIQTYYGKMNGFGWFLSQLVGLGMEPFVLETDDVDFSPDAFINNIFEEDNMVESSDLLLKTIPLVSSEYTVEQVVDTFNNLRKSKPKNKPLLVIMFQGLPGGSKTFIANELVKALIRSGILAMYICQDSMGKDGVIQAIENCRLTDTIAVIARCHLGQDDKKIYLGSKGLRNGDRLVKFSVGTNDIKTLLRSILGVIHRDSQVTGTGFSYSSTDPDRMLQVHRDLLTKWSNNADAYPEEVFGPSYMIDLLASDPFEGISETGSFAEIRNYFVVNGLLEESGAMTEKMHGTLIPIQTTINRIMASLISPSTIWGTWNTGCVRQSESVQKKDKVLYFCLKFDVQQVSELIHNLDLSNYAENATFKSEDFHTTMWFCTRATDTTIKTYMEGIATFMGRDFAITVKSFSRDAAFGRLDIELPSELTPFYKNEIKAHITLVHTGKASETGTFEPTQIVPLQATIQGKVMAAIHGNKMVDTLIL